jgi:hypothetical protein
MSLSFSVSRGVDQGLVDNAAVDFSLEKPVEPCQFYPVIELFLDIGPI